MLEAKSANGSGGLFGRLGSTPFRKQLGWHVAQEEPHAALMTITPSTAEEMLRRNEGNDYRNRAVSRGTFERYVNEMKRGWRLTGETIIFSKSGRLLNGQHRLKACVEAGVPFDTFVVFGIDEGAFAFMDIGKKRTAGDIFSINGIPDANKVAAAAYWVWKYHNSDMQWPESKDAPGPDRLFDYYINEHPRLSASLEFGRRFGDLAAPSLMMALHYLCGRKNQEQADHFFRSVATGENLQPRSPGLVLRNKMIESRIGGKNLSPIYEAAFTVLAWNAMRRGRHAGMLRWRTEQAPSLPFPSII